MVFLCKSLELENGTCKSFFINNKSFLISNVNNELFDVKSGKVKSLPALYDVKSYKVINKDGDLFIAIEG
jgi:nitrite reductase/ring-hydroxylating ferredoxin subunit